MHLSNRLLSSLTLFQFVSNHVMRVKAQKPTERGKQTAWTDPGLVDEIPGAGPPIPLSPDLPFAVAFATDPGPINVLDACWPGFTIPIGTRGCEHIDSFGLPFGGVVARIGRGLSTLHIIGTGPSAAAKSTSVCPYIVGLWGIAAVVAVAVLVEEVVIEEEEGAEASTTPCGSHQRDVDEVGHSDLHVAVAGEG